MGVFVIFLRSLRGWSQAELAMAAKINQRLVSLYELGKKTPRLPTLERLAASVGLPLGQAKQILPFVQRALAAVQAEDPPPESALGDITGAASHIASVVSEVVQSVGAELRTELVANGAEAALAPEEARQHAEAIWEYLKDRSARDRRVLIDGGREYRSWAVSERLCHESERAAAADAARAEELATLAVRVAELTPGEEAWRQHIHRYALAFLGNARRVAGDLPGAEAAFDQAQRLWRAPLSDSSPLQEWRVLDLEASLRREQRRWAEALRLHDQANAAAPVEERGRILLKKAGTLEQSGDYQGAMETLRQAAHDVEPWHEPRLGFALQTNLALNLCHLGRYAEAEELLPEARRLAAQLGNELDLVRLRWVEGLAAAGLGRTGEAIEALSQVREEFISRGIAFDAALASLELAVLYLEGGRIDEVKTLARQMTPIFQAQGVHREALGALKLFCEAAEQEAATVELARRVMGEMEAARRSAGPV